MIEGGLIIATGALSLLLTAGFRRIAIARALLDIPNVRSSHDRATPRGGGIAIVLAFLSAAGLLCALGRMPVPPFASLAIGGLAVAAVGFIDDVRHVHPAARILVHFAAAFWALAWIGGFPPLAIGAEVYEANAIGFLVGALLLVWLLNLYNFMDGIDGIAAAETVSVAGSAAVLLLAAGEWEISVWLLCLASSAAGFLFWNWPPARIFMGDVGSGFLGYALGVFALLTASAGWLSIWTWIILLGAFLADASVTVLRRMLRGDRWYAAHRSHAYQHAARRWGSHRKVTIGVLVVNLVWLLPLAILSQAFPDAASWLVVVAILPLIGTVLAFGAGKPESHLS